MSRTIRRKTVNYLLDKWVTHKRNWLTQEWLPKADSDVKKHIARQHSDAGYATTSASGCGPSKMFRRIHQKAYRGRCKAALHKWLRDCSYEVVVQSNPYLPYWD